jgi:hypothetical protein
VIAELQPQVTVFADIVATITAPVETARAAR